jgi:hypothetical protein
VGGERDKPGQFHYRSHLFTVRLWAEEIGGGQREWRGRIQHVTSGEAYYFRDWPTLIAHILKLLPQPEGNAALEPGEPDGSSPHETLRGDSLP